MAKRRSKVDFGAIYAGDKQGYNIGLDGSLFVRREASPRVFSAPRVGTAGKSTSAATPSLDISAGTDNKLKVAVDKMTTPVLVTLAQAGKTTGSLIAAELELKINDALLAANRDERVTGSFTGGKYEIESQGTGVDSKVVITDADTDNVADALKLGTLNLGVEAVGTNDQDFLLHTSGGPSFNQPIESNAHRSGRYHAGIIKKKKVAEFDFDTYINMAGAAGASIDTAVRMLWTQLLGVEEVVAGVALRYKQGLPNFYFSLVRVSTIFAEYYTGAYVRTGTLTADGASPATMKWAGKASKAVIAGIAKVPTLVTASASVGVTSGEETRFEAGAPVMVVDADGRTILAGFDGDLLVASTDETGHAVGLSAPVTVPAGGFLVFWHPGACGTTAKDAIYTDLVGSLKLRAAGAAVDVSNYTLEIGNEHNDLDAYFGKDANAGFVAGNRCTMKLSVAADLSNENFGELVSLRKFGGLDPVFLLGDPTTGRAMRISASKWIPAVPSIEVPENGTTPVTMEGNLFESTPGAKDPVVVSFE
jgi:hypothetical protein